MTHRLLILTDGFVPPMQGTRMRNLAGNLMKMGWHCELVCEATEKSVLPADIPVHPFYYYKPQSGTLCRKALLALDKLFAHKEKQYERFVERNVDIGSFDAILASAYLFPLRSVYRIALRHGKPLFMDLRDIAEQWDSTRFMQHSTGNPILKCIARQYVSHTVKWRNKCLGMAKRVVSVSPWHVSQLKKYNPDTHLIFNGYDESLFTGKRVDTKHFVVSYTGSIYNFALRNPQILFQAVNNLIQKQEISAGEVQLLFYVEDAVRESLLMLARNTGVGNLLQIHDFVMPEQIPEVLAQSSVSLILNSTATTELHGILPTKLYEAIGSETPVLCIPVRDDDLQRIVSEQQCGLATDSVEETERFLLEQYRIWKQQGFTRMTAKDRQRFSRQSQAIEYSHLLTH